MSITLTYDDDLSRVQIAADSLSPDEVRVERSRNQAYWQTVRGGSALAPDSGEIALDDFEFDADVENFYRVVDVSDDSVEESDSITPSLAGQVWLKSIKHPFLNTPVKVLDRGEVVGRTARGNTFPVAGRSVPVSVHDLHGSREFELRIITTSTHQQEARHLDLMLAAGGPLFVHVPAGSGVPGGYVRVGDSVEERLYRADPDAPRVFVLPCTVVAPPAPSVVGGTMTYGALLNLYGGYANVLAANGSYADLLALMASPDDLVVI